MLSEGRISPSKQNERMNSKSLTVGLNSRIWIDVIDRRSFQVSADEFLMNEDNGKESS